MRKAFVAILACLLVCLATIATIACSRPRIEARPPEVSNGVGVPITMTELSHGFVPEPAAPVVRRQSITLTGEGREALSPRTLRPGTRLRFHLFEKLELTAVVEYVEAYGENGVAVVAMGEDRAASLTMTYAAGRLAAFLDLPNDGDVEIVQVEAHELMASQLARELRVTCRASAHKVQLPPRSAAGAAAPAAAVTSQIDVGVMYTTAALCQWQAGAGCSDEAKLRQSLDTWALRSSKHFSCSGINARVNVVALSKLAPYTETGSLEQDVDAFNKLGRDPGDTVLKFREDHKADVVLVLESMGDDNGYAEVFEKTANEFKKRATGAAIINEAFGYVLLHELGHTMGGGHQQWSAKGRFRYSHGNVIKAENGEHLTLMAAGAGVREALFAGPKVPFGSGATGSSSKDNVKTLNETRGMVELFQGGSPTPPPTAIPCQSTLYPPLSTKSTTERDIHR